MGTQTVSLFIKQVTGNCDLPTGYCGQGILYTNLTTGSVISLDGTYTITINDVINDTIVYTIAGDNYSMTSCIGMCESINVKLPMPCCSSCIIRLSTVDTIVLPTPATEV